MENNFLQNTIEMSINKLREWCAKGGGSGGELFFAPWISVILLVASRGGLDDFLKMQYTWLTPIVSRIFIRSVYILLIYMISNILSMIIMDMFHGHYFFFVHCLKWSEYEQRDGRLYRKNGEREQDFNNYVWFLMIAIIIICKCVRFEWQDSTILLNVLETIAVWGELRGEYLNGETWEQSRERKQSLDGKICFKSHEMYELRGSALAGCMFFFSRFISGGNEARTEEMEFPQKYRAIYDNLRNDKSILITDVFYHDWERAFFIPLHRFLLHDRKVIILAGANINEEDLIFWVKDELKALIGIEKNWRVHSLKEERDDWDILVVPYEMIPFYAAEADKLIGCRSVFVLVMEPSRMMMEMRPYLEEMTACFHKMEEEPVYCFADQEYLGLLDGASHVFRVRIEGIAIDWTRCPDFFSYGIDDTVQSDVSAMGELNDYWGNDAAVLRELLKNDETALVCSNGGIPIWDKRDSIEGKILGLGMDLGGITKENIQNCKFVSSFWEMDRAAQWNVIIDDSQCNFINISSQLSSRAQKAEHVFVLSERYLLRQFLWENAREHMFTRNYIPTFIPIYRVSERNKLIKLIFSSLYHSITKEQIISEFPELTEVENPEDELKIKADTFLDTGYRIFIRCGIDTWKLDEEFRRRNAWWLEDVFLVDERLQQEVFGCRKLGHIYQNYLPGQYLTHHGRFYRILSVTQSVHGNRMLMQRSSSFVRPLSYCHQLRKYCINTVISKQLFARHDTFELYWMEGEVHVTTNGYVEYVDCPDARGRGASDNIRQEVNADVPERSYKKKQWLYLKNVSDDVNKDLVYLGFSLLFTEISRTILPCHYPYLAVMPVKKTDTWQDVIYELDGSLPDMNEEGICIMEDSMEDMGVLDVFALHFLRIIELCHQYCNWAAKSNENYYGTQEWRNLLDSLKDFLDAFRDKAMEPNQSIADLVRSEEAVSRQEVHSTGEGKKRGPAGTAWSMERKVRCAACGRVIQNRSVLGISMYCEPCRAAKNRMEDYQKNVMEIMGWLNRNMGIYVDVVPKIRLRLLGGKWAFLPPVIVRNRILYYVFLCKRFMDRDRIDCHILYAYIELWYHLHKNKCRKVMETYSRCSQSWLLATWFQIQYLYLTDVEDFAKTMKEHVLKDKKRGSEFGKFILQYPILEGNVFSDNDLQKLTNDNPIAKIMQAVP